MSQPQDVPPITEDDIANYLGCQFGSRDIPVTRRLAVRRFYQASLRRCISKNNDSFAYFNCEHNNIFCGAFSIVFAKAERLKERKN